MSTTSVRKRRSTSSNSSSWFKCGCRGSKSVSISASGSSSCNKSMPAPVQRRVTEGSSEDAMTSVSTPSYWEDDEADTMRVSSASVRSFAGLLRQLNELEQSSVAWGLQQGGYIQALERTRHRRSNGDGGGWRVEEGVPMVKDSEDPLSDFRRSMLQMIVEKEIVDGEELRELLRRFLALNSPTLHELIIRAFTEIWEEVFSGGYEGTPLRGRRCNHPGLPPSPPPF